jgi:hypothetical protein
VMGYIRRRTQSMLSASGKIPKQLGKHADKGRRMIDERLLNSERDLHQS